MVGAQATVMRTASLSVRAVGERDGAGLVETGCGCICLSISIYQSLKQAVLRTAFAQIDFVVAQEDMGIDHPPTLWTDAPR
jgi:hypothetical protein